MTSKFIAEYRSRTDNHGPASVKLVRVVGTSHAVLFEVDVLGKADARTVAAAYAAQPAGF